MTSAPKLCDLTITPRLTTALGTLRISVGVSDLEGDLVEICAALARKNGPPLELQCDAIDAEPEPINAVIERPPITLMGAATGTSVLYLQRRDARGARSAVVSAEFVVGVCVSPGLFMRLLLRAPIARHLWPCSLLPPRHPVASACVGRRCAWPDLAQRSTLSRRTLMNNPGSSAAPGGAVPRPLSERPEQRRRARSSRRAGRASGARPR
jgi:hypothetical protein